MVVRLGMVGAPAVRSAATFASRSTQPDRLARFFIDHGMGIVIGGNCLIGDDVTSTSANSGRQTYLVKARFNSPCNKCSVGKVLAVPGPFTVGEGAGNGRG